MVEIRRASGGGAGGESMERLSLREAAERTSRSITTLRRYIRSGRLRAEKRPGRFGPEYFVVHEDLIGLGLEPSQEGHGETHAMTVAAKALVPVPSVREGVPMSLFQELQMKHEQLLVQYGMVRAAGLRTMELREESEAARGRIEELETEIDRLRQRLRRDSERLLKNVREGELVREALDLENAALREKVRGLELITRNAVTTETIEKRYREVAEQARRVDRLETETHRSGTDH